MASARPLPRPSSAQASVNRRQRRLARLVVILGVPVAWFWFRELRGNPVHPGLPPIFTSNPELMILAVMLIMITGMMMIPMMVMVSFAVRFCPSKPKFNVLPLDNSRIERFDVSLRPSLTKGRTEFTYYPGMVRIPEGSAPDFKNKSYRITAEVEIPESGAEGVLFAAPSFCFTL